MFIVDKPYVSDFLKQEILANGWPVLRNTVGNDVFSGTDASLCSHDEFASLYSAGSRLYCNSENSLDWILDRFAGSKLSSMITVCKDKVAFRDALKEMYPDFYYKGLPYKELAKVAVSELAFPCIVKPAVGFFSMGVHRVDAPEEWKPTLAAIETELESTRGLYPEAVMNSSSFIIEECALGEEFAIDAYFDADGEPVILNILHHVFSSGKDVSDRVYSTSTAIMQRWLKPFTEFLRDAGSRLRLANFASHTEVRVYRDEQGNDVIIPIEMNPMRFAGWCTTDVAHHAWGISPYQYFMKDVRPDWDTILTGREHSVWSLVIAELPKGISPEQVHCVDYEGLEGCFDQMLEVRKIDWNEYPVLAIMFPQTSVENMQELDSFLRADLTPFVQCS